MLLGIKKTRCAIISDAWTVANDLAGWPGTWKYDWKTGVQKHLGKGYMGRPLQTGKDMKIVLS